MRDMHDIFDEFKHQLPDIDPDETQEWIESLDALVKQSGADRARFVLYKLLKRARMLHVGLPPLTQTRYINTISPEQEPNFPGDEAIELRIRRIIRWNAVAMVLRANSRFAGIGGHLATYASAASLYEVGFNHFFRGKDEGTSGDQIFFQGHAAPGIYSRAFLEGRLTESQLDHFRREVVRGQGLSSYPHPRLMPDFWEYPTVSMGLGPISAIYQARFNRYLQNRGLLDTSRSRVWAFLGDGETDEPESLGALHVAAREGLDNLTFVVNCNLQRLDGPVRGNGKIIQELEAVFRGSGWNVIKVVWAREWDELLARDVDGVLVNRMGETTDGESQRMTVADGAWIREHFFGTDPRLRALVEHLSDEELRGLRRGGHDYRKVYAAYHAAVRHTGAPTAILAQTVKGWALGPSVEARNVTHQAKKMTFEELKIFRDRLQLPIPDKTLAEDPPYFHPGPSSPEMRYMLERRRALGGSVPKRVVRARPLELPADTAFAEFAKGSGSAAASPAAGTSYATPGEPMLPFYVFYSMFGFQRTGDQIWAFGDTRGRGFMLGATAGRTTLNGEGLQHEDGHSQLLATALPNIRAYDPAFAFETALIVKDGIRRMLAEGDDVFYYITLYNENYPQPAMPDGAEDGVLRGIYLFKPGEDGRSRRVTLLGSGAIMQQVLKAQKLLQERYDVAVDVWSDTREALRRHFEIDPESIATAALHGLALCEQYAPTDVAKAIADLGIDPEKPEPRTA